KAGHFRQDLFYRLAVLDVRVPPLRERPEDVALLAAHFAAGVAARLGRPAPTLTADVVSRLQAYSFPGNVRELQNVIERALILNPTEGLRGLDLAPEAGLPSPTPRPAASADAPPDAGAESDLNLREVLTRHERALLIEADQRAKGVRKETARLLGIDPRNLAYYLRKH